MRSSSTVSTREMRAYFILLLIFSAINLFGPQLIDRLFPLETARIRLDKIIVEQGNTVAGDSLKLPARFDINAVTRDELIGMGIPGKTAATWVNFRRAIDGFDRVEELKQIYGLDSSTLERLSDHAYVTPSKRKQSGSPYEHNSYAIGAKETNGPDKAVSMDSLHSYNKNNIYEDKQKIDLNAATEEDLMSLPGIGPVFSERIVKFRKVLGGFHSVSQVAETYGLPPETYKRISDKLEVEADWEKLDLNTSSEESLSGHPYISWETAGMIVRYREQNGPYETVDDLIKLHGLPREVLTKMKPYIVVHPHTETIALGDSLKND